LSSILNAVASKRDVVAEFEQEVRQALDQRGLRSDSEYSSFSSRDSRMNGSRMASSGREHFAGLLISGLL